MVLAWAGLSVAKSHEVELENAQSGFRSEVMLQRDSGSVISFKLLPVFLILYIVKYVEFVN